MSEKMDSVVKQSEVVSFANQSKKKVTARIIGADGSEVFSKEVEAPSSWSDRAVSIVAQKYLTDKEDSVFQMSERVAGEITAWGVKLGYFSEEASHVFFKSLNNITLQQLAAFNSPVWFNVGCRSHRNPGESYTVELQENDGSLPQSSACFIQGIDDSIKDIMAAAEREAVIFKYGSGSGINISTIRSSKEKLSNGGMPSGPLSFMKIHDQVASVVKSGGRARRAAQMRIMNMDHPDILDFIRLKSEQDRIIKMLTDAGMSGGMDGDASRAAGMQNANLSVRITDEFMEAVERGDEWILRGVKDKRLRIKMEAGRLMDELAKSAWECGDPGIQFHTTINKWNTCPGKFVINGSNPCGEFVWADDSACNLASVNLLAVHKHHDEDPDLIKKVVNNMVIAQNILMDFSTYPSKQIATNTNMFRPIGLGIANLGGLLMETSLPYDSDRGREKAASLVSTLTAQAYTCSVEVGKVFGRYPASTTDGCVDNLVEVLQMHRKAAPKGTKALWDYPIKNASSIRNAQVSLVAPAGTISFLMDCATTGVEPEQSLKTKVKELCDGGSLSMDSTCFTNGLVNLGYSETKVRQILEHIGNGNPLSTAPHLSDEDKRVFYCALPVVDGDHYLSPGAHIRMMAAIQPLVSGAISKTIMMPNNASINDVKSVITDSWKAGLKSITIYRDGSKPFQPLNIGGKKKQLVVGKDGRKRLPATRDSVTHKFDVGGHEGYITVGKYEDGTPGEMFVTMSKEGSIIGGLIGFGFTAVSMCLQHGVKLSTLIDKFKHTKFDPNGFTSNPEIPSCTSVIDYIFQWVERQFTNGDRKAAEENKPSHTVCMQCGGIMQISGSCSVCPNCGESAGVCG